MRRPGVAAVATLAVWLAVVPGASRLRVVGQLLTGNLGSNCRNCPASGIGEVDDGSAHRAHRAAAAEHRG